MEKVLESLLFHGLHLGSMLSASGKHHSALKRAVIIRFVLKGHVSGSGVGEPTAWRREEAERPWEVVQVFQVGEQGARHRRCRVRYR